MNNDRYENDLTELRTRNRTLGRLIGVTVMVMLLQALVILRILGTEHIVLVPPSIDKTFWVNGERTSASYLDQMGGFVLWLILDVSPSSMEWKTKTLLTYASPDEEGDLKIKQGIELDRLKKLNASTSFVVQQMTSFEASQSVIITGRLRTQVNGQETSVLQKTYLIQFAYKGGKLQLQSFKEMPNVR